MGPSVAHSNVSSLRRFDVMATDKNPGKWIAIGIAIGAGIGVAMGNIAIGVGIGVAIGVALAQTQKGKT